VHTRWRVSAPPTWSEVLRDRVRRRSQVAVARAMSCSSWVMKVAWLTCAAAETASSSVAATRTPTCAVGPYWKGSGAVTGSASWTPPSVASEPPSW